MRHCVGKIYVLLWLLLCNPFTHAQVASSSVEKQRLADGLYSRGMYDFALAEYKKLLLQQPPPENLDLLNYRAGECAARSGQLEQARRYFTEAIRVGQNSLPAQRARYRLADDAFRNGSPEKAEALLREIQQSEVHVSIDAPVRFTLAQILETRQQLPEALALYQELIEDYPEDSLSAYAALRVAALSQGEENDKRQAYLQALKHPPSRDFEVEALWGLATLDVSEKNYPEAAKTYWRLWENYPDSARVRGGMIHLAWAQLQAGEFEKALTLASKTSEERKQTDGDTWLYLEAVSALNLGELDEAEERFALLLDTYPKSRFRPVVAYELAGIYAGKGAHEKVSALGQDLQQVPGREVEGLWLLAESARGAGESRLAMQYYTRIAHQYPKHARAADALYFKALLVLEAGNQQLAAEALADFSRRFPQDPRSVDALIQSGDLYLQLGNLTSGLDKWKQALQLQDPPQADLVFKMAMLEIRLERFADATLRLQSYLAMAPEGENVADTQYWLGVLWDQKGEKEASQKALEMALSGNLKPEWQAPARVRLGQSYFKSDQPQKALQAFLPLLGAPAESELSDPLLLWLSSVANTEADVKAQEKIAMAMTHKNRKPVTREWGYYELAKVYTEKGNAQKAIDAWTLGLAFVSSSEEAAEAQLALADLYFAQQNYPEAISAYGKASALASQLELGKLQALGMMGQGNVHAAQEKWSDAARYYMSVAVLYDDPELSPQALQQAANAFRQAGELEKAAAADAERLKRYPVVPAIEVPDEETP
ncbi:tetratricopeptide repeat protein [Kiritimatiellota bacterium B12222]|nr:tetratricopeptide repeat protein [Kiritimatiellota bacterium B12222]